MPYIFRNPNYRVSNCCLAFSIPNRSWSWVIDQNKIFASFDQKAQKLKNRLSCSSKILMHFWVFSNNLFHANIWSTLRESIHWYSKTPYANVTLPLPIVSNKLYCKNSGVKFNTSGVVRGPHQVGVNFNTSRCERTFFSPRCFNGNHPIHGLVSLFGIRYHVQVQ